MCVRLCLCLCLCLFLCLCLGVCHGVCFHLFFCLVFVFASLSVSVSMSASVSFLCLCCCVITYMYNIHARYTYMHVLFDACIVWFMYCLTRWHRHTYWYWCKHRHSHFQIDKTAYSNITNIPELDRRQQSERVAGVRIDQVGVAPKRKKNTEKGKREESCVEKHSKTTVPK